MRTLDEWKTLLDYHLLQNDDYDLEYLYKELMEILIERDNRLKGTQCPHCHKVINYPSCLRGMGSMTSGNYYEYVCSECGNTFRIVMKSIWNSVTTAG
jgi:DNA-directed RNA polymerase subunit RPC12/RpoP